MLDKTAADFPVTADRYGQPGYHSLVEVPQRGSVFDIAVGCGWPDMDHLWRIYPGQFTICTGVAGHGKSTFLLNVVANVARKNNLRTFMYVPENESHIYEKMKLIWGDQPGFDEFAADYCFIQSAMPEHYDSTPKTLNWVLDRALVAIERDGVNIVLIDPWNELERAKGRDQLMTDYIGECLMKMKQFCRSKDIAVILVAHPTKAGVGDGKTPTLSDIEGSMNWHNKCDNGLIVVREPVGNITKVISAKVRETGAGKRGQCFFYVDENTGAFTPQHVSEAP
jgi:twinkle protein